MSCKKSKSGQNRKKAKLGDKNRSPCVFCERVVDDEVVYGKLYSIGDIQCHYFCVLLSSCLVQKGEDNEGLFGFLYTDILAEVERSKKHRCSYCGHGGATLGCSVSQCRKQFHLPCGRERDAVSLFYGNYKSYCRQHAPKQTIPVNIMDKAKLRKRQDTSKRLRTPKNFSDLKEFGVCEDSLNNAAPNDDTASVCVICYEAVEGYPTINTFWPPCCARDAWFHRHCLQRMALSAGIHYLKCPLCNDKSKFYQAVVGQGYYVPDRDAAWELEQNAYAEIYERPVYCDAAECECPLGRDHDAETGAWVIQLCMLCGSSGVHEQCSPRGGARHVCDACAPAAPHDLDQLETKLEMVTIREERSPARRAGPMMPSRMSLRSTKRRLMQNTASTSTSQINNQDNRTAINSEASNSKTTDVTSSREELNLKPPKRPAKTVAEVAKLKENTMLSPIKLLERVINEKRSSMGVEENIVLDPVTLERVKRKFSKPKPLSVKKKIVNEIIDSLFNNLLKENSHSVKCKEPVKAWASPKKNSDVTEEVSKVTEIENLDAVKIEPVNANIEPKKSSPVKEFNPPTIIEEDSQDALDVDMKLSTEKAKTDDKFVNKEVKKDNINDDDESSSSTFQLPPEFIADHNSDDSLPIFDTPKKLMTVDIKKDSSMEISEDNQVIHIDFVKMEENSQNNDFLKNLNIKSPIKSKKCAFKFSPVDKETLQNSKVDIDVESFKNQYLNEIDRDFKCNLNEKPIQNDKKDLKLGTATDIAVEMGKKEEIENKSQKTNKLKRRRVKEAGVARKKRKMASKGEGFVLKYGEPKSHTKLAHKRESTGNINKTIDLTIGEVNKENENRKIVKRTKKSKKNLKTKLSIRNNNIQVRIKWKKQQFKLKITESKNGKVRKQKKKVQNGTKSLKQCILNYYTSDSPSKDLQLKIVKPENDVTPMKKKFIKQGKSPDTMRQTSIENFFKLKAPNTN